MTFKSVFYTSREAATINVDHLDNLSQLNRVIGQIVDGVKVTTTSGSLQGRPVVKKNAETRLDFAVNIIKKNQDLLGANKSEAETLRFIELVASLGKIATKNHIIGVDILYKQVNSATKEIPKGQRTTPIKKALQKLTAQRREYRRQHHFRIVQARVQKVWGYFTKPAEERSAHMSPLEVMSELKQIKHGLFELPLGLMKRIINALKRILYLDDSESEAEKLLKEYTRKMVLQAESFFRKNVSPEMLEANRRTNRKIALKMVNQVAHEAKIPLNDYEKEFYDRLARHFGYSNEIDIEYSIMEILSGAHVLIADDGALYDELSTKPGFNHKRQSSHYSDQKTSPQQYAVRGKFSKEILYGKMEKDGKIYSWCQLEANPMKGISRASFNHIFVDFVRYRMTGKNQGPMGSSIHTENNEPLLLE